MNTYLIALGSNMGDREYYIDQAINAIRRNCGNIVKTASILETDPIGAADQTFLNTAVLCRSDLDPEAIWKRLAAIEIELGRERKEHWGNRTIDCDIILWQNADGECPIHATESLQIPHAEAHRRLFVLEPAAEIAGEWTHPVLKKTVNDLRQILKTTTS